LDRQFLLSKLGQQKLKELIDKIDDFQVALDVVKEELEKIKQELPQYKNELEIPEVHQDLEVEGDQENE
jgi:uncharacterized membrane protein